MSIGKGLEDARKLAHGTYDDVIVIEHRRPAQPAANGGAGPHVVLELPERSRVLDTAGEYVIDGVTTRTPPEVGRSYRLTISAAASPASPHDAVPGGALRYETMVR